MILGILKLWKKDLCDLYDSRMYDTKPSDIQIKIKALQYLKEEINDLCSDPAHSIQEAIDRLKLFEESNWFYKRARTVCQFDHSYGDLKDDQRTDGDVIPVRLSNASKLRLMVLGWIILLIIWVTTKVVS